jgi:hypothetical protein
MRICTIALAFFSLCTSFLSADIPVQQIRIGPEAYHVNRNLEDVSQNGSGVGIRGTYDRIIGNRIYWGGEIFYGRTCLNGKAGNGRTHSHLKDFFVDGNLGFTFQFKKCPMLLLTPFIGYGYFREVNKFRSPSVIPVKFCTTARYFSYGFLSNVDLHRDWSIGANLRIKFPWEPRCHISNDPRRDSITQHIGEKSFYRVELPVLYKGNRLWCHMKMGLSPFYEVLRYGKRHNPRYDFYETKLQFYGATLFWYFAF